MNTNNYIPIEHVIVLMLENRSYDHMLGYFPNNHGLSGDEIRHHRALLRTDALEKWHRGEVDKSMMSDEPLSLFQEALVGLAHRLNKMAHGKAHTAPILTEHEAAVHIHESLARFLEQ